MKVPLGMAEEQYMDVSGIALSGMLQAQDRMDNTARRISTVSTSQEPTADATDFSADMVALMEAKNAYAANAQVMRTADQIQRNVLNILA